VFNFLSQQMDALVAGVSQTRIFEFLSERQLNSKGLKPKCGIEAI